MFIYSGMLCLCSPTVSYTYKNKTILFYKFPTILLIFDRPFSEPGTILN